GKALLFNHLGRRLAEHRPWTERSRPAGRPSPRRARPGFHRAAAAADGDRRLRASLQRQARHVERRARRCALGLEASHQLVQRHTARQQGQAIPLIGLLIVILIGMAGLVVDGGQLTMQYRASQNAADAAALTAANHVTNGYTETQSTTLATTVAQRNQIPSAD